MINVQISNHNKLYIQKNKYICWLTNILSDDAQIKILINWDIDLKKILW